MNKVIMAMFSISMAIALSGCGNVQEKTALKYVRYHLIDHDEQAAAALCYGGSCTMDSIGLFARLNGIVYTDVESRMQITSEDEQNWKKTGRAEIGLVLKGKEGGTEDVERKVVVRLYEKDGKWLVSGID